MTTISLFTPINYTRPRSYTELAISTLSHYFYLGGMQATVVKNDEVQLEDGKISWNTIALKVASYVLLFPLTLPLLAINLALRYQHHFTVIRERITLLVPQNEGIYRSTSIKSSPLTLVSNLVDSVAKRISFHPSWQTLASQSPLIKRTGAHVDTTLLQFLLNDYVGGGEGHNQDRAVDFFKHYLDRYLAIWPEDAQATQIGEKLESYIYESDPTRPLTEVANEIWERLEQRGYICLGGGLKDGDNGGHALFYEFAQDSWGQVTFQITNSGDGLQYHPQIDSNTHYRTLVFSGATLSHLKQNQFLELLLSFNRTRPPLKQLDGIIFPLDPHLCSIHDLYVSLLHGWPGTESFLAKNPGRAQHGKSCSLQAMMKWFKGTCDHTHHSWLKLWIKLSAFSDYLDNNPEHSSQFIADAVRKLSSQIDKMDQQNQIPPQLFDAWKELSQRALEKKRIALTVESEKRASTALTSRVTGLGLDGYQIVKVNQSSIKDEKQAVASYNYPHAFPGEMAPLTEIPTLARKNIAPLFDEMSNRLNLARLLPFCTNWGPQNKEVLENLGKLTSLFFYSKHPFPSLQVPDSFFVDLLNVWMGVYLAAKREGTFPKEVLLEWIRGASLLVKSYTDEFRFDSPQTRKKWTELSSLIASEEASLESALGVGYTPPPNYWTVWDQDYHSEHFGWCPFGIAFLRDGYECKSIETLKELPEMAHYARRILQTHQTSSAQIIEGKYQGFNSSPHWIDIHKAIDSFGCKLPIVPYYDVLRESLASLFVLADRHLSKRKSTYNPSQTDLIDVWPEEEYMTSRGSIQWRRPALDSVVDTTTRLKTPKAKPECILPKTEAKWEHAEDLNQRIKGVLMDEERQFPFSLPEEEHELLTFVQKETTTRIPEMLVFFRKCLHKISLVPYQAVFEHLLFSKKGGEILEGLFCSKDASIPLLFQFFVNSYEELLKSNPKAQVAAASLVSSHLRLFQMSCFYDHPDKKLHEEQLFKALEKLILAGQKNPILGKALGEAVFAALPTLEFIYPTLLKRSDFLASLTTTCLLECVPGDYTQSPYSQLQLHYGWVSFNALLDRHPEKVSALWKSAAMKIFGKEESSHCVWDRALGQLQLKSLTIDVASRTILNDEFNMRLIPKEYRDYKFRELFNDRNFFSFRRQEGKIQIYAFVSENDSYELRVEEEDICIYKKFGEEFYKISRDYPPDSLAKEKYTLWQKNAQYLLEETKTRKIIAAGSRDGLQRCQDGKQQKETLSTFDRDKPTFLSALFNQLHLSYLVWADPSSKCIQSIEVPSLQLEFIQDKKRMHSKTFPGFYLAVNQHVQFLKNFVSTIVLENAMGRKKVIVPILPFMECKYKPYAEEKTGSTTIYGTPENQPYLTFDLTSGASEPIFSPHPRNQTSITWLVSLYIHTRQYRKALDLLKETHVTSQRTLSPLTKQIVEYACNTSSDTHPHAIALRLKLRAWHGALKGKDCDKDLDLYDSLRNSMGVFALSPKEFPKTGDRFKDSTALVKNARDLYLMRWGSSYLAGLFTQKLREKMDEASMKRPEQALSLHVSSEAFILNFFHHCDTIHNGSEIEKNKLRQLLYFTCQDQSPLIKIMSRTLLQEENAENKTDIPALFRLEDDAFQNKFTKYLETIDHETTVIYPSYRSGDIHFNKEGYPQTTSPRAAKYTDTFQPMFPISFDLPLEPLPFSSLEGDLMSSKPVDLTAELHAVHRLSEWAIGKSLQRLNKGALQLKEELLRADPEQEIMSSDPILRESALQSYQTEISARNQALQMKERAILDTANDLHNQHQLHLEVGRELRDPFDIETLLIALGRKDLSVIRNSNPSLSNQEIAYLMQEMAEYACLRGDVQQLMRAEKCLKDGSEEYINHARAKRCYNPAESPDLLVFEVLSNLVLRKEQVEALKAFTPGTLLEARTGFGKSKVLLPLWLLLTAQTNLAIFIAPANLFESQERYLQELLKKAYHFFAIPIEFSRNSPASVAEIAFIKEEMERAEKLRRPVFMSDQTAHNLFVLKLKELSQDQAGTEAFQALLDLRKYVNDKKVFIDEPHKVLDDRQEFNYSIGLQEAVKPAQIQFEIDLYKNLFSLIKNRYQLECFPDKNLPFLTEEAYRREIIPSLLDRMIQATPEERRYLAGNLELEEQQQIEQKLSGKRGGFVRLLHDQLHYYLPQTLQRHCDAHYALNDPEGERVAIPLEDARNPRQNNEFVSIDQLLNFTIQANLKTPLSLKYVRTYLQDLSKRAAEESDKEAKSLKETKAYQTFIRLTQAMLPPPSGLLVLKPMEIHRIQEHLNQNIEAKLQFIQAEVLPKVRTFQEKVSSSPHLLVHCFKNRVVGSSGTLSMQHFPYTCQIASDEKAIVRTIVALLKKNDSIVELNATESRYPIAALQKQFPDSSVMIEVGALLRHYPNIDQIAQEILKVYPQFVGVASFDHDGHPVVMTKNSTAWIPEEIAGIPRSQLFWFYGQKDTTGRDEKLGEKAVATVLVDKHTTLTHLIQGIGRMRGILNGQRAKIAIDKESTIKMRKVLGKPTDALTLLDIISYCAEQEGTSNGYANFRSLSLQLDALIENCLWDTILETPQDLQKVREYIIKSTKDEPLLRPSMTLFPVDRSFALEKLLSSFRKKIQQITAWKLDLPYMEKTSERIRNHMHYPEKVYLHHQLGTSQIVETTSAEQTTTTLETQTIAADLTETISAQYSWTGFFKDKEPLPRSYEIIPHSLSLVFSHPRLEKYQPLFTKTPLYISQNALCTFTGDIVQQPGLVNGYMKPLHYIAQLPDGCYVLIDTQEAAQILKQPKTVRLLWLVNHGPLILNTKEPLECKKMELQAKLLNGDLQFTDEQQDLFNATFSLEHHILLKSFVSEILQYRKIRLPVVTNVL